MTKLEFQEQFAKLVIDYESQLANLDKQTRKKMYDEWFEMFKEFPVDIFAMAILEFKRHHAHEQAQARGFFPKPSLIYAMCSRRMTEQQNEFKPFEDEGVVVTKEFHETMQKLKEDYLAEKKPKRCGDMSSMCEVLLQVYPQYLRKKIDLPETPETEESRRKRLLQIIKEKRAAGLIR